MQTDTSKSPLGSIGNYTLIAKIAEGGMGWVYKGQHKDTGQVVAIKIVPSTMTRNDVLLKRFEQEWKAAAPSTIPTSSVPWNTAAPAALPFS